MVIVITFLIFFSSLFLLKFIGTDFMPESDESRLSANIELQTGLRVEETTKVTRKLEQVIKERYPEVSIVSSSSGADDEGGFISMFSTTGTNIINFTMRLKDVDQRDRTVWEIADDYRDQVALFPEVVNSTISTSTQGLGGSSNTVDYEIYGYNFDITNSYAEKIFERIKALPGAKDVVHKPEKRQTRITGCPRQE